MFTDRFVSEDFIFLVIKINLLLIVLVNLAILVLKIKENRRKKTLKLIENEIFPKIYEYLYARDEQEESLLKLLREKHAKHCSKNASANMFLHLLIQMMQNLRGEVHQKLGRLYSFLKLERKIEKRLRSKDVNTSLSALYEIGMFQLEHHLPAVEQMYRSGKNEESYEALQTLFMLKGEQALAYLYRHKGKLSRWQQMELVQSVKEHLKSESLDLKSMFASENESLVDLAGTLVKIYPQYQLSGI